MTFLIEGEDRLLLGIGADMTKSVDTLDIGRHDRKMRVIVDGKTGGYQRRADGDL